MHLLSCCFILANMFLDVPITSNDSENSAIIGGSVGGVIVLLLMITVVLCTVIVCVRRSHEKGRFTLNNKVFYNTTKLNANVTIEYNPSYDVPTKPYSKTSEYDYDYVQPNELVQHSDLEDTIKMETNPSYGVSTEKQHDYDYVRDDHHLLHHNTATNIKGNITFNITASQAK